ncbi:MAG: alkylated DNA repair protein (DNA oxidative demethylase) [Paracoccaceae bacterium]|jgi:alkylated DNA repair protein (DNA oxidative demethylase)
MQPTLTIRGFQIFKQFLDPVQQRALADDVRAKIVATPFFEPMTPSGKPMSVRMTSLGEVGWLTDRTGYRYSDRHPNGASWPPIPESVLNIWSAVSGSDRPPDSCLLNFYAKEARMGLHQDKDEANFDHPVVSISLGDEGLFRVGNLARGGSTESLWLGSGDVVVMGGAARLIHHGLDRIRFGSSQMFPKGGRLNLTLRVAGDLSPVSS